MNDLRKRTRQWLIRADREDFNNIIYKAKITPRQQKIIKMRFIDDLEIFKIAQKLNLSETRIQTDCGRAYTLIGSVLQKEKLI